MQNPDESIDCQDSVYGQLNFPNDTQDDVILIKADGMPTYHFANVVDDHLMHISHVLRGEEWLSSTPKHLSLYKALGFEPPNFVHLPLLVNADGSKLSKRSGDVRVEDFIAKGYEPEALLNFVALMGMNHSRHASLSKTKDETTDVMTTDEMISIFSVESISKHRSTMSQAKLDFLNQQHLSGQISSSDPKIIQALVLRARKLLSPITDDELQFPTAYIQKVMYLMRDRLHIFSNLKYLTEYFFCLPDLTSAEARAMKSLIAQKDYLSVIRSFHQLIESLPDDEKEIVQERISEKIQETVKANPEVKRKTLMTAIRHAITGRKVGAGLAETIEVLGKEKTIERLKAAIRSVQEI